jgi:hypothetical protein
MGEHIDGNEIDVCLSGSVFISAENLKSEKDEKYVCMQIVFHAA